MKTTSIEVVVRGVEAPVFLRPGTSDEPTFGQVFVERQYDFDFGDLRPGFIIDGGANVGFASVLFKNLFPDSRIVAVEPESSNCEQFRLNLRSYSGVQLVEGALWPVSGKGCLVKEQAGAALEHWAFQVTDQPLDRSVPVQLYTVKDLMRIAGASSIDILKLDIEGAEDDLFSDGCEEWLGAVQCLILEFHEQFRPGCAKRIIDKLMHSSWTVAERGEHFMFRRSSP